MKFVFNELKNRVMEILLSGKGKRKKWSMNGITYYYKSGKLCQCKSRNARLVTGKKKDGTLLVPTPEQVKARAVFKMMFYLKGFYFRQIEEIPILDVASGTVGQNRWAKFHRANAPACDERGVVDFPSFEFSVGKLFQPMNARVIRKGWTLIVTWENRENRELSRMSDGLRVGYFYDSYPKAPKLLPGVVAKRGDCRAEFTIPDAGLPVMEGVHVYLFFMRKDKGAFSSSKYFRV